MLKYLSLRTPYCLEVAAEYCHCELCVVRSDYVRLYLLQVIQAYVEMLRKASLHFGLSAYIFSPNFAAALFRQDRGDPQQVEGTLKREKFFAYDRLIFPINVNNNHWVVVGVNMSARK